MDIFMQTKIILLYGVILLCIYTIFLLMLGPLKLVGQGIIKVSLGALSIFLINSVFGFLNIDFSIGLNLITSIITGYLGVFGVLSLAIIKCFLI